MSKLVIVESPTKAKTISKFLGKDYKIESSYGHIRDLPKSKMGIDVENDFEPQYVVPPGAKKNVSELKKIAVKSEEIILATDEDREGEAIAWHLAEALNLKKTSPVKRIVFHEITKQAIEEALKNPREIDMRRVDAQQARRVLDRLFGYELSPFLWKKIKYGLSAGRVQSVAVRLIVEREREIEKFTSQEYWSIIAKLGQLNKSGENFIAKLHTFSGKALKKFDINNKLEADRVIKDLNGAIYTVASIQKKEVKRNPSAPFTTSTLQQEAARKFGYSAKQTMLLAQQLYETGHITYMRTDSVNLAETALAQSQEVIQKIFGKQYRLTVPRRYQTKSKGAQEAHEAVRPTDLSKTPDLLHEKLDARQLKLYDLIWKRTLASQMPQAIFDQTTVDITARPSSGTNTDSKTGVFRANGQIMKFDGFIKIYTEGKDENGNNDDLPEGQLPELKQSEALNLKSLDGNQHFTVPPPRYTDATLIKTLEEYGIGRPSTYAPTISTIIQRGYVERREKKFHPTEIGLVVNDMLVENFPKVIDYQFTAHLEENLDEIASGKLEWRPVVKDFYNPFKSNLEEKKETVEKHVEQTEIPCPDCGKPMLKKFGRYGQFLACSNYPECKGTKPLPEEEAEQKKLEKLHNGQVCSKCQQGELVIRRGRFGLFLGCNRYPECKYIEKIQNKTGLTCPDCTTGEIVEKKTKRGKKFWGCSRYPKCEYATWNDPVKADS